MTLWKDVDDIGKQVQQKRAAEEIAKEAAKVRGKAIAEAQRRHEEDKKQGMI